MSTFSNFICFKCDIENQFKILFVKNNVDEFFIPISPHNSIMDVVHAIERKHVFPRNYDVKVAANNSKANKQLHPMCYILLQSETILNFGDITETGVWIGQRFSHNSKSDSRYSFKKPIFPTDLMFQAGLHTGGACSLPPPW